MKARGRCETDTRREKSNSPELPNSSHLLYISGHTYQRSPAFPNLSTLLILFLPLSLSRTHTQTYKCFCLPLSQLAVSLGSFPLCLFYLHPTCSVLPLFGASFDKSESITMRGCSPAKYSLQSALAGFLQICEYLNKDKIRCKQINQGTEEGRRHLPFHTLLHQFTWGRLFQDSFSWNVWGEYVVGLWYKMSGNITSLSSKWICATLHLSVVIVYCVMLLNWKRKH